MKKKLPILYICLLISVGFIKGIDRMKRVCVIGSGAFGTAMASLLADNGFEVNLWCFEPWVADSIAKNRTNEFLPDVKLSERIKPFINMAYALEGVKWIFEATPVTFLRSVLLKAKPYVSDEQVWVVLSKGIENETLLFPSQIIDDVFEKKVQKVVVSGPSFAKNIVLKQLTRVDIASDDPEILKELKNMFDNAYFSCHMVSDIIGVQIGGALKNVMAIATGILEGAGYTDNTKALLLTEGLQEMARFAEIFGGEAQTLYGLSGVGDLILTCMGGLSRNLMVGKQLGQGETLDDILKKTKAFPEGINTVKSVYQMIAKEGKYLSTFDLQQGVLPIFECMYEIIYNGKPVSYLIDVLSV